MTATTKITYTSATGDLEEFHHHFDVALGSIRQEAGALHPFYIDGAPIQTDAEPLLKRSPIDGQVLGRFSAAGVREVDSAVDAARRAQRGWAGLPWQERVAILRRAASIIRSRKYQLAALMSLEVGKSRLEAMGDAEESADLIDYYCQQVEEADGFVRPMNRITPVERNVDVLRPYGVRRSGRGECGGVQTGGGDALDRSAAVPGI
jgi:1-pyrroline-5-carboxylate dehydrogenase